jgi:hypothetical protein
MGFGMKIAPASAALKRGETEQAIRVFVDGRSAEPGFYGCRPM